MGERYCRDCKMEEGTERANDVFPGTLFDLPMAEGVRVLCEHCIRKSFPISVWILCCMTHEADTANALGVIPGGNKEIAP